MAHPVKQGAYAPAPCVLTGRHKAPTGAPASTHVRVGGEGTPERAAVEPRATLPGLALLTSVKSLAVAVGRA